MEEDRREESRSSGELMFVVNIALQNELISEVFL